MGARYGKGFAVRVATALVLLPLWLLAVLVPPARPVLVGLVAIFVGVGISEYYAMAKTARTSRVAGVLIGAAIVAVAGFGTFEQAVFAMTGALLVLAVMHLFHARGSIAELAASLFGVFYVGWLGAYVVFVHALESGPGMVLMLIVAVALTDVGAYFAGKQLGRHKMAPVVSPNKTWEGAFGGLLLATAGVWTLGEINVALGIDLPAWPAVRLVLIGALLSAVSQLGDLMKSAIKRDAGVKDSGTILPGHGGMLDRCDGFLFAAPVLYYIAVL